MDEKLLADTVGSDAGTESSGTQEPVYVGSCTRWWIVSLASLVSAFQGVLKDGFSVCHIFFSGEVASIILLFDWLINEQL